MLIIKRGLSETAALNYTLEAEQLIKKYSYKNK